MLRKRLLAISVCLAMAVSFAACQKDETPDNGDTPVAENTTLFAEDTETTASSVDLTETTTFTELSETVTSQTSVTSRHQTTTAAASPEQWTKAQIVDVYKKAAAKSDATAKSDQVITLTKISVNNGEHQGVMDFITPIMSKLLSNNSKQTDGITGGFNNLTESDIASAKAYKNGSALVIEMQMHKQTAGINEDAKSGSVGHAITAVGDISVVTKQLKDLGIPLELNENQTKIHYTNPKVKVVIDPNGKIVNGTWQYTVEIRMDNYKAFGKDVKTTSVIMKNVITVNGGFKK